MGLCAEEPFSVDYVLRLLRCVNAPELRLAPVSCWGRNVSVVDSLVRPPARTLPRTFYLIGDCGGEKRRFQGF